MVWSLSPKLSKFQKKANNILPDWLCSPWAAAVVLGVGSAYACYNYPAIKQYLTKKAQYTLHNQIENSAKSTEPPLVTRKMVDVGTQTDVTSLPEKVNISAKSTQGLRQQTTRLVADAAQRKVPNPGMASNPTMEEFYKVIAEVEAKTGPLSASDENFKSVLLELSDYLRIDGKAVMRDFRTDGKMRELTVDEAVASKKCGLTHYGQSHANYLTNTNLQIRKREAVLEAVAKKRARLQAQTQDPLEQFDSVSMDDFYVLTNLSIVFFICLFIIGGLIYVYNYNIYVDFDFIVKELYKSVKKKLRQNWYVAKRQVFLWKGEKIDILIATITQINEWPRIITPKKW